MLLLTKERFSVRRVFRRITRYDDDGIRGQVGVWMNHPASLGCFPDAVPAEVEELDGAVSFGGPKVSAVVAHHAPAVDGEVAFGEIVEFFVAIGSQVIDLNAVFQSDGNEGIESDGADGQAAVGVCADSSVGQRELDDIRVGLCQEVLAGRNEGIPREPVADIPNPLEKGLQRLQTDRKAVESFLSLYSYIKNCIPMRQESMQCMSHEAS